MNIPLSRFKRELNSILKRLQSHPDLVIMVTRNKKVVFVLLSNEYYVFTQTNRRNTMTKQNKKLFREFYEFCKVQPEDKKINHSSWGTCAVGEFANYKGVDISENFAGIFFASQILGMDNELRSIVGNADGVGVLSTYGGFTDLLETYL